MAIVRWNPFREMENMLDQYARAFGRPMLSREGGQEVISTSDWSPAVDISETDKEYLIKVEVPGIKKDDVKVTVHAGVLTIKGERKSEKEEKGEKFHRVERYYGSFARSFTLPENVNENRVTAEHKDGVLTVHLEKQEPAKPQAIEVKID
ncbi:MAG: Hsp20/alpha crystallin family protein [Pseudomonadota bacterium]